MSIHSNEFKELFTQVRKLSPADQLALVSQILSKVRRDHLPPPAEELQADARAADEWAAHYVATRGWEAPYPLTDEELALIPKPEVRCQDTPCNAAKSIS